MHKTVFKACVQAVHELGILLPSLWGLYHSRPTANSSRVHSSRTYTLVTPTFVLGLVHYFFRQFVSVTVRLMPTIHTTNKDHNKFKLRITHRELCI